MDQKHSWEMTVCWLLVNVGRLCPCTRLNFNLLTQIPVDSIGHIFNNKAPSRTWQKQWFWLYLPWLLGQLTTNRVIPISCCTAKGDKASAAPNLCWHLVPQTGSKSIPRYQIIDQKHSWKMAVCWLLVNVGRLCPCARLNFNLLNQIPVHCIGPIFNNKVPLRTWQKQWFWLYLPWLLGELNSK